MDPTVNAVKGDMGAKNDIQSNWRQFIVGPIIVFYTFVFQAIFTVTSRMTVYPFLGYNKHSNLQLLFEYVPFRETS
jgi:hypothetical protein